MKHTLYLCAAFLLLASCQEKEQKREVTQATHTVNNDGKEILFADSESLSFFTTEKVNIAAIDAEFQALGVLGATVLSSNVGASQNIILFENSELASNYTQLIQHQINIRQIQNTNIKQKQIELKRTEDLFAYGAATGQDLLNVQTELSIEETHLANEKTALIEHEVVLQSHGFNPGLLRSAKAGTAYIICNIPENLIEKIVENSNCSIAFTAFPNKKITGKVDAIADMVDNATRMIKVRILIDNAANTYKAGMFANVTFHLSEGNFISIPKEALTTVQGKHYVFIKQDHSFERREVQIGQQIGDKVVVYEGLVDDEHIVTQGVMQLKGLSFGY
ncbi:MAG TPA: efflux RND transporter periplasmic adaptor subunit [Flavobacterium sp.]|nr:efflux RND transporter periplasmic adaptor subunit [Flavobacterium sp.]